MRITPAYNIFSSFNYQNTPAKQNAITAFKGTDTNDEFIPETHIRSEQEEAEKRKYNLFKAKIDNVQVEGNNVTIETLDGKTKKLEIPEVCFENIKDRQKAVEKWLIDIADEELCGSLELCVAAQELGLCEENETINEYKQALEKGIKVLNYSYNNRYIGKSILDLEIDDIPHRFLTYQSLYRSLQELNKSENCTGSMIDAPRFYSDEYDIQNMVKNIRAAGRGSVITVGNKDIVLPQILDRVPDVKKDEI
ncbi:hypothetical protein IJ596_00260, partial [bacterium]|nr:hypothetical protein [bacterium]